MTGTLHLNLLCLNQMRYHDIPAEQRYFIHYVNQKHHLTPHMFFKVLISKTNADFMLYLLKF